MLQILIACLFLAAVEAEKREECVLWSSQGSHAFIKQWMTRDCKFHPQYQANAIEVAKTASAQDSAYLATKNIVRKVLRHVPDEVWNNLVRNRARVGVFSINETTCVYPEYAKHKDTEECRGICTGACAITCTEHGRKLCTDAHGFGGIRATVGEEDVLCTDNDDDGDHDDHDDDDDHDDHDHYLESQNILIHDYSHTILDFGLPAWQRDAIFSAFNEAKLKGIWNLTSFAMSDAEEYWAEATGVWFGVNKGPDTGGMNGYPAAICDSEAACRKRLQSQDPKLADILRWTYSPSFQPSGLTICPSTFDLTGFLWPKQWPDCWKCQLKAIAHSICDPNHFIPECNPEGTWVRKQFDQTKNESFCVDASGNEIPGSRTKGMGAACPVPPTMKGRCSIKLEAAEREKAKFIPDCAEDGSFEEIQCYKERCWCVFPNGQLLPDTFHSKDLTAEEKPNCSMIKAFHETCEEDGLAPHPHYCSRYYRCGPTGIYSCVCPEGALFDEAERRCNYGIAAKCTKTP